MSPEMPPIFEADADAHDLYTPDGKVDIAAVEAYLNRTAEPKQTNEAETYAQARWQEWTSEMERRYGGYVPAWAAHRIYGLGKLALKIPA